MMGAFVFANNKPLGLVTLVVEHMARSKQTKRKQRDQKGREGRWKVRAKQCIRDVPVALNRLSIESCLRELRKLILTFF